MLDSDRVAVHIDNLRAVAVRQRHGEPGLGVAARPRPSDPARVPTRRAQNAAPELRPPCQRDAQRTASLYRRDCSRRRRGLASTPSALRPFGNGWCSILIERTSSSAGHDLVLASLEVYVRARVGSVFEWRRLNLGLPTPRYVVQYGWIPNAVRGGDPTKPELSSATRSGSGRMRTS